MAFPDTHLISLPSFTLSRPAAQVLIQSMISPTDGKAYRINSDFRTVLACLKRLSDPNREAPAKMIYLAGRFFLGCPPPDMEGLFAAFVTGGGETDGEGPPVLDFEQDAGVLFASFLQQYGIDLLHASLHWFAFRQLLAGLTEATPFGARVRLRTLDESRLALEDRARMRRMKEKIAVTPRVGHEERALMAELDRRLAAGENPGDVLEKLKKIQL